MSTNSTANTHAAAPGIADSAPVARKSSRRWMQSVIAASAEPLPSFPWMRGVRRTPQAVSAAAQIQTPAAAPVQPRRVTLAAR